MQKSEKKVCTYQIYFVPLQSKIKTITIMKESKTFIANIVSKKKQLFVGDKDIYANVIHTDPDSWDEYDNKDDL